MEERSVELSIAHKTLDPKCNTIIEYLKISKIMASIKPNKSIVCYNSGNCIVENGCQILFGKISKPKIKDVWVNIQTDNDLTCAHIDVPSKFSGCIYDYLSDSKCPG